MRRRAVAAAGLLLPLTLAGCADGGLASLSDAGPAAQRVELLDAGNEPLAAEGELHASGSVAMSIELDGVPFDTVLRLTLNQTTQSGS